MDLPGILGGWAGPARVRAAAIIAGALFIAGFLSACTADLPGRGRDPLILLTATRTGHVVVPYAPSPQALAKVKASATPPALPSSASATSTIVQTPTLRATREPSATPTITPTPTITATPTASATPTVTATPSATPIGVLGISVDEIVQLSPAARDRIRETFALGQQLGRDPRVFSKVGDSVALTPHYLTFFDTGRYTLGDYAYLQPTIDNYAGSFERYGVATRIGLHAWSLFDPLWADKEWCQPNEDMIACEIRLNNPSVLLIRLGSNDGGAPQAFEDNMRLLVQTTLDQGIVPILSTKADRFEGPDNRNNLIVRALAKEFSVPLWDFDFVADAVPNRGLGGDDVHMTMSDYNDYTDPETFERGYPVSDLTALMALHAVYMETAGAGDA